MLFFWHKKISKIHTSNNNKPSLRDRNPVFFTLIRNVNLSKCSKKRVSSFTSCYPVKASMTLEAALVLPSFLFAMLGIISVTDIIKIQGCMDVAVAEVGNELAIESYGEYINELIMPFYIKRKINSFLENNLSKADYDMISGNIRIADLSVSDERNLISFRVNYKISPKFKLLNFTEVNLTATYYGHKWLGFKAQREIETMVFLSDTALVYHLNKNCKYLNITIIEIPYVNLSKYRNNSGEKYTDCDFCNSMPIKSVVYITPEGSNYHTIRNCIGLTRSIHTVPLSSVRDKRVCSGCGE